MRPLSDGENDYYNDLEQNFDKHVEKYRQNKEQELKDGKRAELESEHHNLVEYNAACMSGEVSDLLLNIDFCHAKAKVLRELLGIKAPEE